MSVTAFTDPILGFAGPPIEVPRPERATLADLIALVPLHSEALRPHLRVKLGGELIDPALYHRVLPKADAYVQIVLPVHGGKGGILGTLAVIALVGASVFVGAAGLPFLGSAFAAGSVGANLVAGGLSLAASLLLQGLNTPQATDNNAGGKSVGVASAQNSFEPGAYLQRVLGTRRVTPQLVMPPYSRIDGDDQIVTAVYGLAGPHQIEDIRVGSADIDGVADITYEVREGFASDTDLTLVTDTRIEIPVNLRLSQFRMLDTASATQVVDTSISPYTPQWHRVQTKRSPDSVRLFLSFDAGLIFTGSSGQEPSNCAIHLRIRRRGTVSWYNLPEFLVRGQKASGALRLVVDFQWLATADMPGSVTAFSASYGGWRSMFHTVEHTATATNYWSADSYFATNKVDYINKQQLAIYLDTATFPQSEAYEIEVMRGYSASDNILTLNTAVQHTITFGGVTSYDFFSSVLSGGQQKIPPTPSAHVDTLVISAIQSIWDEYPFDLAGQPTALIAIEARNRSLEQVTAMAGGYMADWDGADWVADQVTSNPSSHYRHVLRDDLNAEPTPVSLLPDEELQDWHEWCAAEGLESNVVVQGQPVDQVLSIIAQAGMARPRYGATYGVVIDRPRDPVTVITQRNASGFSFSKPFGRLPHALKVNLPDEDRDYEVRELIVYADGYNADGSGGLIEAGRFESITYEAITGEVQARRRAQRDMRFARYRSRLINFSVDIEHLAYTLGDLVLLETDILGQIGGRGRVRSISTGGGLVTGLVLDEQRDFTQADADGAQRAVAMRLQDGSVRIEQVTGSDADLNAVAFTTPFAMPTDAGGDLIVAGTLVVSGAYEQEARRVLIWDIAPGPDLTAQITAIDYAENVIYGSLLLEDDGYLLLEDDGYKLLLEEG